MQNVSNAATFAEQSIIGRKSEENVVSEGERTFALDTTFVLFFLALDLGQASFTAGLDGLLSVLALITFIAVPYFLPFSGEKQEFRSWVIGRIVVAAAGLTLGLMLSQAVGVMLPESFRYVPMTLLIVSAIFSCYLQIYGIIRFRLAR